MNTLKFSSLSKTEEKLFTEVTSQKVANRDLAAEHQIPTQSHLIFCEHPHVYTLGKSGEEKNHLANETQLKEINATHFVSNGKAKKRKSR